MQRHGGTPHFIRDERSWVLGALWELERSSSGKTQDDDKGPFAKRLETVQLPEGVRAVFKRDAGASILELMHRTGSHAQVVSPSGTVAAHASGGDLTSGAMADSERLQSTSRYNRAFNSMTLWGTAEQNAEAIKILPELTQTLSLHDLDQSNHLANFTQVDRKQSENDHKSQDGVPEVDEDDSLMENWSTDPGTAIQSGEDDLKASERSSRIEDVSPSPSQENVQTSQSPLVDQPANDTTTQTRAAWTNKPRTPEQSAQHPRRNLDFDDHEHEESFTAQKHDLKPPIMDSDVSHRLRNRSEIADTNAFAAYIEDLTVRPSMQIRRESAAKARALTDLLSNTPQTTHFIAQELIHLFSDRTLHKYASSDAVTRALHYLATIPRMDAVRDVFAALESSGIYEFTSSNFNVLLAVAAKHEDVHNFTFLLERMRRQEVRPSWRTWASLHDLVCRRFSSKAVRLTEERMRREGVLGHPQAIRQVVANRVSTDLTAYLDAHAVRVEKGGMPHDKDVLSDFLALYDEHWNPLLEAARAGRTDTNTRHELAPERRDWLSVSAANRMIQVLLIHGRTQDAFTVIQKLEAAGEFPRVETLNTFLSAASKARDAESAIAALQFFAPYLDTTGRSDRRSGNIHLNDWSFTILFTIAWRGQCYNLLRTIWRYGVCSGQIDSKVLSRLRSSLLTYVPARPSFQRQQIEKAAQEQRQREWETAFGHLAHRKTGRATAPPDEAEQPGVQAMGIKERDLFFGWAAKFAVGVDGDAVSSSSSSFPFVAGGAAAAAAAAAADDESATAVSEPSRRRLSEQDHQILDFSTRMRTTPDDRDTLPDPAREGVEAAHRDRYAYFNDLLRRDLAAAGNFRPIKPLVQAAEEAFQLDLQWKRRRMGKMTAELDEVVNGRAASEQGILSEEVECSRARRLGGMFREMLGEGVRIPVRVGDMSRE
ncbi:hypothetical protein KC340_g8203 [Hortaea werneckii]|nr:hypothetical protein KC342_g3657 [Hortaea werneckii]KAI7097463.1 hypothetical protein KC339_g9679 [Hortaea werneckii]KAI7225833.1 hypothetical protein KC365_g9752 [Hortaea werneckii]KAI7317914.1 hypothetical protein KC340_g8203 [Hortaea werneckii]KAI7386078.1 hypothetical protein KC328_g10025 [Hortaea werneckii]